MFLLCHISFYVKTSVFDVELSDIITEAFEIRSDSDYDDYYLISKAEVIEQIQNAEKFETVVEQYVEKICHQEES